ncbi:MAG: DUF3307 domain-containing protein [Balneolaceae bacterium]|nr:DUF3307 domain-containing protein [Balneolaceae bacterium]
MEIEFITKLILAHLIGDFFLQPKKWVENKEEKKWNSPYLAIHCAIHFVLILLIFWDATLWKAALFIAITHYFIDGIKLSLQKNRPLFWFMADQVAHIGILIVATHLFWQPVVIPEAGIQFWLIGTGLLFLTFPAAFIMQNILSIWNDEVLQTENSSLAGAGLYIGILERVLVFISVLTGHLQVVGFLIAAKSVFRFSDLTREKDRKLTEYIIVGTLLSFLIAIATGMLVKSAL